MARTNRKKLALAFVIGAVAAFAGLWVIPTASSELGPATVGVRAYPGVGETHLRIPPLGAVSAETQRSPISIVIALENVHIEQIGSLGTTASGREQLRREVEDDLRPLIIRSAVQVTAGMLILGLVAGAALFRRELWPVVSAVLGATVVAGAALGLTAATYDLDAFREPRYTGSLQRARGVIDAVQQNAGLLDQARTRYEVATERAATLLAMLAEPDEDPLEERTAILHVGDIHGNPIGLDVTQELAGEFDVDAIVDTGDLASSSLDTGELSRLAEPLERSLIRQIEALPAPYVFVAGNHDSFDLRRELEAADNVVYLDGDSTRIGLIDLFGWADPTYTPDVVDPSDKADARLVEAEDVAAAVTEAAPDVLVVHDPRLASASIGRVPLVLAGHMHAREIEEADGTMTLTVGSTGATGLSSFTVEADLNYEAQIVYFDGSEIAALDYVTVGALGSEFVIERTTFATGP